MQEITDALGDFTYTLEDMQRVHNTLQGQFDQSEHTRGGEHMTIREHLDKLEAVGEAQLAEAMKDATGI